MLSRIASAAGIVAVLALASCSRTLALRIPADTPLELKTFVATGVDARPRTRTLQPKAPDYQRLQEWLGRNQSGWSQSFSTTPGQGVIVHAPGITLHFLADTVFASTDQGQFQKQVRHEDYAFLEAAIGI